MQTSERNSPGRDGDVDELKVLDVATRKAHRKRFYQAWVIILVSTGIGFPGGFPR